MDKDESDLMHAFLSLTEQIRQLSQAINENVAKTNELVGQLNQINQRMTETVTKVMTLEQGVVGTAERRGIMSRLDTLEDRVKTLAENVESLRATERLMISLTSGLVVALVSLISLIIVHII
ncbi:MAG: hypothetical protein QXH41_06690 [Metallosphaera sp.]